MKLFWKITKERKKIENKYILLMLVSFDSPVISLAISFSSLEENAT